MEADGARADASRQKGGCVETTGGAAFARITGVRLGRFVEFEYFLDDGLLSIELILTLAAFHEFCRARNATVLPPEPAVADELERQAWRSRQPGLLRRVKNAAEDGEH